MIDDKVLGAYAAVGTLPPAEQAQWYRKAAEEWGINIFEIPILAGVAIAEELVETFAELQSSLVVTMVAQWATMGGENPDYGLSSVQPQWRQTSFVHACTVLQQCQVLHQKGIGIRNVEVHTGQRRGETVSHAIALYRSLVDLSEIVAEILPDCGLTVEVTDNLPPDHPIPFPAAKKASLQLSALSDVLRAVNQDAAGSVALVVNWGRLLINGDNPLETVKGILAGDVPLAGAILSGAGPSPEGFRDSHNSHLDPHSGFTAQDAKACAEVLQQSKLSTFIGTKCGKTTRDGELSVEEVLTAQAQLLGDIA
jgi:hypothetical protein